MPPSLINNLGGPKGFGTQFLAATDDGSTAAIDITRAFPGGLTLFGTTYRQIYVNNNGNITFSAPLSQFTPQAIGAGFAAPIIAPFWADVDTRAGQVAGTGGNSQGSNLVWYNLDPADQTLTVTWDDVGYYSAHADKADAFQLQLIGNGSGNFQIKFIYQNIAWVTGDASGGQNGLGGTAARAGYSSGNGLHYFELPASGMQAPLLNLPSGAGNSGLDGIWTFDVTGGVVAPSGLGLAPEIGALAPNTTSTSTPTITGFGESGDTLYVYDSSTLIGSTIVGAGGTWSVTVGPLTGGVHRLTATETDSRGQISDVSTPFDLTVETIRRA